MFYLIGGSPRSGKTTIAKELSKKLNIPWISTDTLESVVMEYVSDDRLDSLFPKRLMRNLTNRSNDLMYTTYSSEQIVDAYFEQGNSLADGIEMFIECESSYDNDYILEGYHVLPELVSRLQTKFDIKAVFVGREDEVQTLESITKNPQKNDWVITKTKEPETFSLIAKMLTTFSLRLKKDVEKNNLNYYKMDLDFKGTLQNIVENI